ncbi:MAG: N-acetylmuramoyl-L-alanine amidase [Bacteroidota bacterium]
MKRLLPLLLLGIPYFLLAQSSRTSIPVNFSPLGNAWQSVAQPVDLSDVEPFLAYSIAWEGTGEALSIRFSADGVAWGEWERCERDRHEIEGEVIKYTVLGFADKEMQFFQLRSQEPVEAATLHAFSPGASPRPSLSPGSSAGARACPCPLPGFQAREDWCPSGDCPAHPNPAFSTVTHIIIHHTATSNSSSDWAAVVRSIWDTHVNTRGWSDIGYNWLIDPDGMIYQGRGNDWIGAHFCSTNTNTMGVAMLGTFTEVLPQAATLQSLRELVAWKVCESDLDPLGEAFHPSSSLVLPHISGHQDGCATECPGAVFYPTLPTLRQEIEGYLVENCNSDPTSTPSLFSEVNVQLFPNPMRGSGNINITAPVSGVVDVRLFSTKQQQLLALQATLQAGRPAQLAFDVGHLAKGVYWVYLSHREGNGVFKLLKI